MKKFNSIFKIQIVCFIFLIITLFTPIGIMADDASVNEQISSNESSETDSISSETDIESDTDSDQVIEAASASSQLIEITNINIAEGTADIIISGIASSNGIKSVIVPIWSKGDQNDIYWYPAALQSDGTYKVSMNLANHKYNTGYYYIHVYVIDNSNVYNMAGESYISFDYSASAVDVSQTGEEISASVTDICVPGGLSNVYYAVWSSANGQDDIVWLSSFYDSTSHLSSLTYSKLTYTGETGEYNIHIYGIDMNGNMVFLGSQTYIVDELPDTSISAETNNSSGTFNLTIKGISNSVNSVIVPVWSGDQSDIKWYTASKNSNGNWTVSGSIANHNYNLGTYYAHVYVTDKSGKMTFVCGTEMHFNITYDSITVGTSTDGNTYPVTISNLVVPGGAKNILFPTWSISNGQDDIVWYNGSISGNDYTTSIQISNHKSEGQYWIAVYAVKPNGSFEHIGDNSDLSIKNSANAEITISDVNEARGTFKINVSFTDISSNISVVRIPVWSTSNQSDIKWYLASKQSENTYSCTVSIANHNGNTGYYFIHVYPTFVTGVQSFTCGTTYFFDPSETWSDTLIAHAMGGIDGQTYTNSLEAFVTAYANGLRTFEVDMIMTSDGEVVLNHDWSRSISSSLQVGYIPTLEEFLNIKIYDKYTSMSFADLLRLMEKYPDIWVVTDSKYTDASSIEKQFTEMYNTASELGLLSVFDRIVVQLYNQNMKTVVDNIYHFNNYIFTMYQIWDGSSITDFEAYCQWAETNGVYSICMYYPWFTSETLEITNKYGLNLYLHTLNDSSAASNYYSMGVAGIYTDTLTK